MRRLLAFLYGSICYFIFLLSLVYLIFFVGNLWVPKSIDTGLVGPTLPSILINLGLILLFGLQHSIMARPTFKEWWTKFVPKSIERSTYVLFTSFIFALMFWQWRPLPTPIWAIENEVLVYFIYGIFALGWLLVVYSSFLINHFDLFGLRQVFLFLMKKDYTEVPFKLVSLYKMVRHPMMLGFILGFWAIPVMTQGHLLFAIAMTLYILIGIYLEERNLVDHLGSEYAQYRTTTSMLIPSVKK